MKRKKKSISGDAGERQKCEFMHQIPQFNMSITQMI